MLSCWFAHIVILWSAVTIGVALAGEIYVGFLDRCPPGYGILGGVGLAAFLAALWILQSLVEGREVTRRYHGGGMRAFGIAMALVVLAVHPFVPALVGNLAGALALFSQIVLPLRRALLDMRNDGAPRATNAD